MKKGTLSVSKRYSLIVLLSLFLLGLGAVLTRSWKMTPESHFEKATILMEKNRLDEALSHFILATKSDYRSIKLMSFYHLARLYQKGTPKLPVNMKKAVYYYEQAAAMKLPIAQYQLALLYDVGDKIPEDRKKAIDLMLQAAETLPEAKYALAVWIERGYLGKTNQAWAVALYEQAANAGIKNAMRSLISIYHSGYGHFPENIRREQHWRSRLEDKKK